MEELRFEERMPLVVTLKNGEEGLTHPSLRTRLFRMKRWQRPWPY